MIIMMTLLSSVVSSQSTPPPAHPCFSADDSCWANSFSSGVRDDTPLRPRVRPGIDHASHELECTSGALIDPPNSQKMGKEGVVCLFVMVFTFPRFESVSWGGRVHGVTGRAVTLFTRVHICRQLVLGIGWEINQRFHPYRLRPILTRVYFGFHVCLPSPLKALDLMVFRNDQISPTHVSAKMNKAMLYKAYVACSKFL